jgi:vacuolar-type H+-ATPase subunit E/Vma4
VFDNKVMRRIFLRKIEKLIRGLRKLHSEELRNIILVTEYRYMDDQLREGTTAFHHITGMQRTISEIKREIKDNIKTNLEEIGLSVWT